MKKVTGILSTAVLLMAASAFAETSTTAAAPQAATPPAATTSAEPAQVNQMNKHMEKHLGRRAAMKSKKAIKN